MRHTIVVILLGSGIWGQAAFGQSMIENAAAAAGGSVGGVAGKKVSDSITSVFGKVDKQTKKAAGETNIQIEPEKLD